MLRNHVWRRLFQPHGRADVEWRGYDVHLGGQPSKWRQHARRPRIRRLAPAEGELPLVHVDHELEAVARLEERSF
eukprot:834056-Prymnesium_polylepis.1